MNTISATAATARYGDTNLGISLPRNATIQVRLVADTKFTLPAGALNNRFRAQLNTSADLRIIENQDDVVVSDVVPGLITFNAIEAVESSFRVSRLNRGDVSVGRGSNDIDLIAFQVRADDVSDIFIQDLTVSDSGSTA